MKSPRHRGVSLCLDLVDRVDEALQVRHQHQHDAQVAQQAVDVGVEQVRPLERVAQGTDEVDQTAQPA